MRSMRGVPIAGVLIILVAASGVVAANETPMAEAGLDQDAIVNSTVFLDAGGSWDPDGEIVSYEWRIERPNGTMTTPACRSCTLTEFVPQQAGRYNVTIVVTDDDGASMTDTLYLYVSDPGPATPAPPASPPSTPQSLPPAQSNAGGVGSVVSPASFGTGSAGPIPSPSRVVRTDNGAFVLQPGPDGNFEMMVGGEMVQISASKMQTLAVGDGQVTYSEAARYFHRAGANRDDVRHALQNANRQGICEGNVCTFMVAQTSGAPDNGGEEESFEDQLRDHLSDRSNPDDTGNAVNNGGDSTTLPGGGGGDGPSDDPTNDLGDVSGNSSGSNGIRTPTDLDLNISGDITV